jgi:hypothetical protein
MSETPSWPVTGSEPAVGTLGDLLSRKGEIEVTRLLEGFSGYLVMYGTPEEVSIFNAFFLGTQLDPKVSEIQANALEEKFQTFSWGADLDKSATQVGDQRDVARTRFDGRIEVSRRVRYWNEDLTSFEDGDANWKPAGDQRPELGLDRAFDTDGSYATIVGIDDAGHPILQADTEQTQLGRTTVHDADSAPVSDLIGKFPKLKNAVAYAAVGRKRIKEFRVDAEVRKLLKQALVQTKSKLIGEKYSMKGATSLVAKAIEDTMKITENVAGALLRAVEGTTDGVRYTVDLETASYTQGVSDFLNFLKGKEWRNTQFKNFWTKPSPTGYRGINTKWEVTVAGESDEQKETESVEVQFHTKESYDAKESKTHHLKEEIRILSNALQEAAKKLATAQPFTTECEDATQELKRLQGEVKTLEDAQRDVFEQMAKNYTPEGAAAITL